MFNMSVKQYTLVNTDCIMYRSIYHKECMAYVQYLRRTIYTMFNMSVKQYTLVDTVLCIVIS